MSKLIDKYLGEGLGKSYAAKAKYKKGDTVYFTDEDDEYYGKSGVIHQSFKDGNYTVKVKGKVISRDNSELSSKK